MKLIVPTWLLIATDSLLSWEQPWASIKPFISECTIILSLFGCFWYTAFLALCMWFRSCIMSTSLVLLITTLDFMLSVKIIKFGNIFPKIIVESLHIRKSNKWQYLWICEAVITLSKFSEVVSLSNHAISTSKSDDDVWLSAKVSHELQIEPPDADWNCLERRETSNFCCSVFISVQISLSPMSTGMKFDKPDSFSTCKKQKERNKTQGVRNMN